MFTQAPTIFTALDVPSLAWAIGHEGTHMIVGPSGANWTNMILRTEHAELIPGDVQLRPEQPEHLRNDSQLECAHAVIRHGGKLSRIAERHGRILAHIGIYASRPRSPRRAKVMP